jgi:hypothetical protein
MPDFLDRAAPWIILPTWFALMILASRWLYRRTVASFEYHIGEEYLELAFRWFGLVPLRRRLRLRDILAIRPIKSRWELIPILGGTMPSLWGQLDASRMLLVTRRNRGLFPVLITPHDAPRFLERALLRITEAQSRAASR